MKKFFTLLLAMLLLACSLPAASAAQYPAVRIDPDTGAPYDFHGKTVYIYDYWSGDGGRPSNPGDDLKLTYEYQDWIMETYNCTIIQRQNGDWNTCADRFLEFAENPDGTLCAFIIEPGKAYPLATQGNHAADWSVSSSINVYDAHWNQAALESFSIDSSVYGVVAGYGEPRQLIYFNKRLLKEAGIDWNTLYDAQANGTWTWAKFEQLLKKTTQDVDNDGVIDIWGLTGSADDLYRCAVFTNGSEFFRLNSSGKIEPAMNTAKAVSALEWAQNIWNSYGRAARVGENWDFYKTVFKNGEAAFYMYMAYGGFNDYSELSDMEDEWGCVAFPLPSGGTDYLTIASDNVCLIPDVYNDEELAMITLAYDLWSRPAPGIAEDAWIGNKYNYTDERAVEETYAMLRQAEHQIYDKTLWLGSTNDILGVNLFWPMESTSVDFLIETAMPTWKAACNTVNQNLNKRLRVHLDLSGYPTIDLPERMSTVAQQSLEGNKAQVLIIPQGCTSIGSRAFAKATQLKYVIIPDSVTSISADAFAGASGNMKVLLCRYSAAENFCKQNGIPYSYMLNSKGYTTNIWTLNDLP